MYDAQGGLEQEYAYDPSAPWMSQPLFTRAQRRDTQAWSVSYFGTSHLGMPEVAFEKSGEVTWRAQAQAFGETQITLNAIDNALRFPGQYFDAETGLYQNYLRDYDLRLGRYVQQDPVGLDGGINIYWYVGLNPIYSVDVFGPRAWAIGGRPPINPWSPQQRTSPGKGPGENGVRHLRDKAQCERHESYPPDRLDRDPPNANNDPVGNLNEQPQTPGAYACPFNSPSCYFETECSMYQCMAGNYYIDSCGSQNSN
ncbi:RHS repeat-associated core domain-containing protein [Pseudomonas sp. NBRC 100443]|uniref:RHS repeat-associated core domain-containing protein n=1 Tax=Pseudomonas sp. NBRC 100443 TaxID=1113665 RepID=UPI0024A27B32|nr:RHS repeat-associated core domain-containing protein [Pseudomonas sp. NBRC 100443]GLU37220.1 hypothetical protein Pssp01_13130 [Pseudomonas sp. NBRC 100443]